MSDGLPKRLNGADAEYGYPRIEALFAEVAEETPDAIIQRLTAGGEEWANGRLLDDDITLGWCADFCPIAPKQKLDLFSKKYTVYLEIAESKLMPTNHKMECQHMVKRNVLLMGLILTANVPAFAATIFQQRSIIPLRTNGRFHNARL
jgi:hypothetical protein